MSVLIRGGRIVTAADDYVADLYVEDETITLIGESLDVSADKVIDAAGKYVLPGCVDPHTHLDMPFGGTVTIDDVESGQTSAAFGGTTCHVDFIIQPQGQTFGAAIDEWRSKANGRQVIDMGYHMAVTDLKNGPTLGKGHQTWQMNQINALIWPNTSGIGLVPASAVTQTATIAKTYGVIKSMPVGATNYTWAQKAVAQLKAKGLDVYGKNWKPANVKVTAGGA